ncbi:hypothetical protein [Parerythrobacter lacustris]|uniref:VanZ-like domain-containing protein n=1 Tax=Parerythrobacter lacustris TaxID=2969984 RepID=A0ABT1XPS5_9SPHN|nr:hypothetical protein [Parerythrobacter lacustris]MCR2833664.1 hypothetical protein [Parerythrobacter lacustris]
MQWLYDFKLVAVDLTGLAKDALHIYVALIVYAASCIMFGWKTWQWRTLVPVLLVALANEVNDILFNLEIEKNPYIWSSVHDMVNTMMLPVLLLALSRWTGIFARPLAEPADAGESEESGDEP